MSRFMKLYCEGGEREIYIASCPENAVIILCTCSYEAVTKTYNSILLKMIENNTMKTIYEGSTQDIENYINIVNTLIKLENPTSVSCISLIESMNMEHIL